MLKFFVIQKDKQRYFLDSVLTAVLDCDIDVPADSLTVTCPYDRRIADKADKLEVSLDGEVIFTGQLDSIITVKESGGVLLRLSARGPAAALVDNEAEPVTYSAPNARLIANRHLAPFGIEAVDSDSKPYYEKIKIDKGMSHWQVLQSFCRNHYGTLPRISGDGKAYLKGADSKKTAMFSDKGEGVAYYSLNENRRRYRLLSEIRLKMEQVNAYTAQIKNQNPDCKGIARVRYVNAAADKTTVATAQKMLQNSNAYSYELVLKCAGCHTPLLGRRAEVKDSVLGEIKNLLVQKVRYTADKKGEQSKITLKKEQY